MKKRIKKLLKLKVVRYVIGGGLAAVIDLSLLYILTDFLGIYYMLSAIISFIFAFCFAYFFQKYITFQNKKKSHMKHGSMFLCFQLVGIGINLLFLWFFVEFCGIYYMYVAFFAKIVVFGWNYFMNNKFNFK